MRISSMFALERSGGRLAACQGRDSGERLVPLCDRGMSLDVGRLDPEADEAPARELGRTSSRLKRDVGRDGARLRTAQETERRG